MDDLTVYKIGSASISFVLSNELTSDRQKIAALAVQHMLTLVGVKESPKNSNKGPYIDALRALVRGSVGAWCAQSAWGSMMRACDLYSQLTGERWELVSVEDGGVGDSWRKNLEKQPSEVFSYVQMDQMNINPMLGDLFVRSNTRDVLLGPHGSGEGNHTGLVVRYDSTERIMYTVEGNTNESGESNNGGQFCIKTLSVDDPRFVGIIRPQFAKK